MTELRKLEDLVRLNIGCGKDIREDCINLDVYPYDNVDIIRDLRRGLPFEDNRFEDVLAQDILEHFDYEDFKFIVDEIWRVLKPRGNLVIRVPNCENGVWAFRPGHKTFFTVDAVINHFQGDQIEEYYNRPISFDIPDIQLLDDGRNIGATFVSNKKL